MERFEKRRGERTFLWGSMAATRGACRIHASRCQSPRQLCTSPPFPPPPPLPRPVLGARMRHWRCGESSGGISDGHHPQRPLSTYKGKSSPDLTSRAARHLALSWSLFPCAQQGKKPGRSLSSNPGRRAGNRGMTRSQPATVSLKPLANVD